MFRPFVSLSLASICCMANLWKYFPWFSVEQFIIIKLNTRFEHVSYIYWKMNFGIKISFDMQRIGAYTFNDISSNENSIRRSMINKAALGDQRHQFENSTAQRNRWMKKKRLRNETTRTRAKNSKLMSFARCVCGIVRHYCLSLSLPQYISLAHEPLLIEMMHTFFSSSPA